MKTPPLLLGTCLIFWGWQTGFLFISAILAFALEASRLVKFRFDLSPTDLSRIARLITFLFLGVVVYLYTSEKSTRAIVVLIRLLPLVLLPLLLAQVYGTRDRVDVSGFFLFFKPESTYINVTYPYFALCILSAGAANVRTEWFYVILFCLSAWGLWFLRPGRTSPVLWITLLLLAGVFGHAGHVGLHALQGTLEKKVLDWFSGLTRKDADPYRSRTAVGDIGSLKLSDRILFRVKAAPAPEQSVLLREAVYNAYQSSLWFALHADFKAVQEESDRTTWVIRPAGGLEKTITVIARLHGGRGLLKLPKGASRITGLPVLQMKKSQFGVVQVEGGPGLVSYGVRFSPGASLSSPPDGTDLRIPRRDEPVLFRVLQELKLADQSPREILKIVTGFFQNNFRYSLALQGSEPESTPLETFLGRTRSGHCEYFATATVLLLRAAGIPARYVTGYLVHEFSEMEKTFVVRSRHAHSWASAYVGGAWRDVDTTPASWMRIEEEAASVWEPFIDFWSWCLFKISEWRWSGKGAGMTGTMGWLLIPFVLLLAWRLYHMKRVRHDEKEKEEVSRAGAVPGLDSQFYLVEKRLDRLGYGRYSWEALSIWIKRIEESGPLTVSLESLHAMIVLHYRYRFDPEGITQAEKTSLKAGVREWLEQCEDAGD